MTRKGNKTIKYTISGEKGEIAVEVELKQNEGVSKARENVWHGVATLNDRKYEHPDLAHCVNAQFMAETIAIEEIDKLRAEHGNKLRVKRK